MVRGAVGEVCAGLGRCEGMMKGKGQGAAAWVCRWKSSGNITTQGHSARTVHGWVGWRPDLGMGMDWEVASGVGRCRSLAIRAIFAKRRQSLLRCRHWRAAMQRMWSSNWKCAERAGLFCVALWLCTVMKRAQLSAGSVEMSTS